MVIFTTKHRVLQKVAKIFLAVILILLIFFCLTIAFVQTEGGQNWLAQRVTTKLSKDLQSRIEIKHVEFGLFNKMNLEGVLVEDRKRDTLLYAGIVQVRITDWFFFKDKAVLEYIGLQDAIINFNRTDSVWNYGFLQDYFSSPGGGKKKAGIEFDLKKVLMKNVSFVQKDGWAGQDMYVKFGSLNLDANEMSITGKKININSLDLVQPFFHQYTYKGNRPPTTTTLVTTTGKVIVSDTALQWNPQNWNVIVNSFTIDKGRYRNDNGSLKPAVAFFDGKHVDFSEVEGSIKNFRLLADTLRAKVDLKTKERSGLVVQSLITNLRFHPQLMEFGNLYLKTNKSVLGDYFAMKFDRIGDMSDFIHAVTLSANFDNASLASDDLAFFAPGIKNLNKRFDIEGKVKGTIDALNGENINIRAGISTALRGNFSIVGLPDINATFINVDAQELRTNYADAISFAPALRRVRTPNLSKLGAIRFNGSFTGFVNDFVTYGTIQTALGNITSDLNMKLPKMGVPVYSGSIATNSFELGQFLNDRQLGEIFFSGDVKGRGFQLENLDATLDGKIRKIEY